MSTTEPDAVPNADDEDLAESLLLSEPLPSFEAPIVPNASISGHALMAVIAIMAFLASVTAGAVVLVRAAAGDWQSQVAREVTIQVRPFSGRDVEADVARAAEIAQNF